MRNSLHTLISILSLLSLLSVHSMAQTTLHGEIKDDKGNPAPDVTIVISSRADSLHTIGYTFSNERGYYSLSFNTPESEVRISVYGFNIRKVKRIVANRSSIINFNVTLEAINLREVTVKAGKLWQTGDTLNYSVGAFLGKNDLSIGDVLKKMPGLTVSSSGEIAYQGKSISHFYIDGLDVLQGRYGIATKNLTPKAVSIVQVLENHQPIKALKKIDIPEQAAINLKLKDSAKGIFNIEVQLGAGSNQKGLLWRNELIGTYFAKKRQHFATYKNGNDGTDIGSELRSFTSPNAANAGQYTAVRRPSPPAIARSHYYFNNSNAFSFNTVWKSKSDNKVNVGLVYFNDYEKRNSYSETNYMLPDGSNTLVCELAHDADNTDKLEGNISYDVNREKKYIKEEMCVKMTWNKDRGVIDSDKSIDQILQINLFHLDNNLHYILKQNEYRGIDITSKMNYEVKPQRLSVYPYLYDTLFNDKLHNVEGTFQKATATTFAIRNTVSMLTALMLGNLRISPRALFDIRYDGIDSRMSPLPEPTDYSDNKLCNDTYIYNLTGGISADLSYQWNNLKIDCFIPFSFNLNKLRQRVQSQSLSRRDANLEFYSRIHWDSGRLLSLESHYSMERGYPTIQTLYDGYILSDYRTLSSYTARLWRNKWQFADIQLNYKNTAAMFFSNLSVSYNRNDPKVLYGYTLNGIFANITTQETDRYSENYSANFYLSKGLYWKGLTFSFTGKWNKSHSPLLRQSEVVKYLTESYSVLGSMKIDPFKFLSLSYDGTWYSGKSKQESGKKFPTVKTFNGNALASVQLPLSLFFDASFNHYYNNQTMGNKSFALSNLSLSLQTKKVRYSLSCLNLFNVRNYTYSYIGEMAKYYSEYHIRPRQVMLTIRFKVL